MRGFKKPNFRVDCTGKCPSFVTEQFGLNKGWRQRTAIYRDKGATGTLWMMTRTFLNPGEFPEYEAWLKNDYKPALEKAGVTQLRVSRPIFGLPAGEVQTVRLMKNFAEIDAGPILTQKLGAEGARALNAKTTGMVRATTITIIRVREDLSYQPAMPTGSN